MTTALARITAGSLAAILVLAPASADAAPCLSRINLSGGELGDLPGKLHFDYDFPLDETIRRFASAGIMDETLPAEDELDGMQITRIQFRGSIRHPLAPGFLPHLRGADIVHVHAIDFFYDAFAITRPIHRKPIVDITHFCVSEQ